MPNVPIGIGAPNVLQDTITAASTNPTITDLTTVTGVSLLVLLPSGTQTTWTASIVGATPPVGNVSSTLTFQHNFSASGGVGTATGDCALVGTYMIAAQLTVPGGVVPCYARSLVVTSAFGT
jgi:hypothetical protein